MSTNSGLTRNIKDYIRGYLRYSILFTGLVGIASLPAFVVALTWFPDTIGYLLVGSAMVSVLAIGNHLQSDDETNDDSFNTERYCGRQLLFFSVALYAVLAIGTSAILLTGAITASTLSSFHTSIAGVNYVGTPLAGIIVATLFPLLDSEASKRFGYSIGKFGMLGTIWLLHAVGVLHGMSSEQFEQTVHQGLI